MPPRRRRRRSDRQTGQTRDTCEARVSDGEVASQVLGAWIMDEQIAHIQSAGALSGTDAVDLRQHVARTADRAGVRRQTATHPHPTVSIQYSACTVSAVAPITTV